LWYAIKAWCDEHERFNAFAEARLYPVPAESPHYDVGEGEPEPILELDLTLYDDVLADAQEL